MRNKSVGKYLMTGCLLATGLSATLAYADWSALPQKSYGRQGYGDFPPKDIDKLIEEENKKSKNLDTNSQVKDNSNSGSQPAASTGTAAPAGNQPEATQNLPAQNYSGQNYTVPNYGNYYGAPGGIPWNNRGSGFTTPWGNNGSGFSGPWNNRGSGFSMPWGNNGSGFSGPWNNNGYNFTGPWDNNGSSFGPWGNR